MRLRIALLVCIVSGQLAVFSAPSPSVAQDQELMDLVKEAYDGTVLMLDDLYGNMEENSTAWFEENKMEAPEVRFVYVYPDSPIWPSTETICSAGTAGQAGISPGSKNVIHCGEFESACQDSSTGTALTVAWDMENVFYCGKEVITDLDGHQVRGAVIFPITTIVLTGMALEFYILALVAHEWGHHITDELKRQIGPLPPDPPYTELLADCLSGVFFFSLREMEQHFPDEIDLSGYYSADLTDMEVLEKMTNSIELGLQRVADLEPGWNHGTMEQRVGAFRLPKQQSQAGDIPDYELILLNPRICLQTYWPELRS
jgi:hypothetical protein